MKATYLKAVFCLMLTLITTTMTSCGSSNSDNETNTETDNAEKFEVGELGYFTDNCIGVVKVDDMDQVMKFVNANDMVGIRGLVSAGKATTFAAGKQVKIIEIGFEYVQVRDINASEMLVWVPKNMLTHEDVYGSYTTENEGQ